MGNILEDDTVLGAVEIEESVGREHGVRDVWLSFAHLLCL
jgi:hypothetical protein